MARALVALAACLWLGVIIALLSLMKAGLDRWWWGLVLLYLPRWPWLVPGGVLLPVTYRLARRWVWAPLLALTLTAGPLMGLRWRLGPASGAGRSTLRVLTYNVDGHPSDARVLAEILRARPDLVVLEEADENPRASQPPVPGYFTAGPAGGCLVASRYPLTQIEQPVLPASPPWRHYIRCRLELPGGPVTLYAVHLDTPRGGLAAIRHGLFGQGAAEATGETRTRREQARGLASALRAVKGPVLVAGDLNCPEEGLACRELMSAGLTDAFAAGGRGYGYTYGHRLRPGVSFIRIDHILLSKDWGTERCWVGRADASDHRPVVAEVTLPRQRVQGSR